MEEMISTDMTTIIPNSTTGLEPTMLPPERNLSLAYTVSEAIVSLLAIFGNTLVVYIFCKNRSLRRYRNYYIVALAIADFFVGLLGIPFAILASVGLPRNLYGCLFTVSILIVLCTVSIFCLVAVSIDRYWATTNPFAYYRNMTTSTAVSIILFCWVSGGIIGFLPLFGWYNRKGWLGFPSEYCFFTDVMDYSYLVFLYFATIVFPAILMIGFYGYIYHVVLIKIRQKGTLVPPHLRRFSEQSRTESITCERSATHALRLMVSEKRREGKAAKKLGIIVLFFMLCWMPLYTINCIQAFFPHVIVPIELLNFTIILSHANSALNPFLYAYHLKEFRLAMKIALIALYRKISCGLVNSNTEKEMQLGAMSRSLTLPSLGNINTVHHHHHTKVSIKFRKNGRQTEPNSVEISPSNNITSLPSVSPQESNLFLKASPNVGAVDRSLTNISVRSDSSTDSHPVEIPLLEISAIPCNSKKSPNNSCTKIDELHNGKIYCKRCTLSEIPKGIAHQMKTRENAGVKDIPVSQSSSSTDSLKMNYKDVPQPLLNDGGNKEKTNPVITKVLQNGDNRSQC